MHPRPAARPGRPRAPARRALLAATALASLAPHNLARADRQWNNLFTSGNWGTPGNWSGSTLPNASDNVFLLANDIFNRTVTLNVSTTFLNLQIRNNGSGTFTLTQPSNVNLSATFGSEALGPGSNGHGVHLQSAGTNTYATSLSVGDGPSSAGLYSLSGTGALNVTGTGASPGQKGLIVGFDGAGTFLHSAGNVSLAPTAPLFLAFNPGASGTYSLSGTGSLTATSINLRPGGTFTQSGGTLTYSSFTQTGGAATFNTGFRADNAAYSLSAGSLTQNSVEGYVGFTGNGTFTQTGGTHTVNQNFLHAVSGASTAAYTLANSASLSVTGIEFIGYNSTSPQGASFDHTGGTHTVGNQLILANGPGSRATYSLASSTGPSSLSVPSANEYIGLSGSATFTHTGGAHTVGAPGAVARHLYLANNPGSSAAYSLSGTGALTVRGDEFIAFGGPASFHHTAGSHTVTGTLHLGANFGATGTYSLSGAGRLSTATVSIGHSGTGAFTHTGGTHSVASTLTLGKSPGAAGTYSLSAAGSLTATTLYVGDAATGTFTHTGGRAVLAGDLVVARTTTSTGHYSLSGGASLISRGSQTIGAAGRATFTQTGGANLIHNPAASLTTPATADLLIADSASSTATYTLSGGFLTVGTSPATPGQSAREFLGRTGGRATFSQTGGTHYVANDLYVGSPNPDITSTASFSLAGGSLSVGSIHVAGPTSTFTWSVGSLTFNNSPFTDGPFSLSNAARFTLTPGANKLLPRYPIIDSHPNSRLDLNDNLLSTPDTLAIDAVRTDLATGHLLSTTAASDPRLRLALAYWLSPTHPTTFRGFPIAPNSLNVSQTYYGDANVDGRVNGDDYAILDRSLALHLPGAYWTDGDFDYDGLVTPADLLLADQTFARQTGPLSPTFLADRAAQFGPAYITALMTSIPEPTVALSWTLYLLSSRLQRRRRHPAT